MWSFHNGQTYQSEALVTRAASRHESMLKPGELCSPCSPAKWLRLVGHPKDVDLDFRMIIV